jgi:hypothetical protein
MSTIANPIALVVRRALTALLLAAAAVPAHADLARVGPVLAPSPPGHGYPKWYQDLNGLVLDLCLPDASDPGALQQTACLLGPPDPPYVFPSNFPDESFYFRATSSLDMGGGRRAILVLALEAAFGNGAPAAGDQIVFTRIRVTAGVPFSGTYRVTHPYGEETFVDVVSSGGNRDIVFTEDIGIAPGEFTQALRSRFGPFLQRGDANGNPTGFVTLNGAQFLSDGVTEETVTGSPFNTNYFEICGPFDGPELPETCRRTNLFTLTGRVHDSVSDPIGSPLEIERAIYARDGNEVRIDVAARASRGIGQAQPQLSAGAPNVPPVALRGPDSFGLYYGRTKLGSGVLPGALTVVNNGDSPPSAVTRRLSDEVTITAAEYDPAAQTLRVVATSSDKGDGTAANQPPLLSLDGYPTASRSPVTGDPAAVEFVANDVASPPLEVGVASSAGGHGRRAVAYTASATTFPPGVPIAVDDFASAVAGGPAISIAVKANDVASALAPINAGAVSILAPGLSPAIGSLTANVDGTVTFTPTATTGTATFRYTVANAVGTSNPATVTINVNPPAGGPVPIANPDGPFTVNVNGVRTIDVLANDSGNGGTLDPATVTVTTGPAAGTTSVNASGQITYTAPATTGTFTFEYTVRNTNGNVSAPAVVTVNVVAPETVTVTRARCTVSSNQWDVRGTSSVTAGNTITLYLTSTVPASPLPSQILGSAPVDATGAWQFQLRGGPACRSPISARSSLGTNVNNIVVQVK